MLTQALDVRLRAVFALAAALLPPGPSSSECSCGRLTCVWNAFDDDDGESDMAAQGARAGGGGLKGPDERKIASRVEPHGPTPAAEDNPPCDPSRREREKTLSAQERQFRLVIRSILQLRCMVPFLGRD